MSFSLPDLKGSTPTGEAKALSFLDQANRRRRTGKPTGPVVIPGLDTAALSRQYGMDNAVKPQKQTCSFMVPTDATGAHLLAFCKTAFDKWLKAMDLEGWDLYVTGRYPITPYPAIYPARDLLTNQDVWDRRECRIDAWFRFRNPKPRRIEVDPLLLEPLVLGKGS